MNCERFEELLFDALDGRLGAAEAATIERHAQACPRCGELRRLAEAEADTALAAPEAMLGEILAASGVDACGRARELLADEDPSRDDDRDPLLVVHLGACEPCTAMAHALVALRRDLPTLAELDPGADFLDAVMRATVEAPRWSTRWNDRWQRLLARPRLALEGAYVGTLILALTFVTPAAAITELPARVLRELGSDSPVRRTLAEGWQELSRTGFEGWERLSEQVESYAASPPGLASARERIEQGWSAWMGEMTRRWQQLREWLIDPLIDRMRALVATPGAAEPTTDDEARPARDRGDRR